MANTLQIATLFLAQLGFGSAMVLPFFPLRTTGKSFLRFYYGFILIFLALFLACLVRLDQLSINYLIFAALACWLWGLSFAQSFSTNERAMGWFFAACSLLIFLVHAQKSLFHAELELQPLVPLLFLTASAVFVSFYLMNMIFGHWYLVNRKLPIAHLIKTSRNLIIATYVRLALVGTSIWLAHASLSISAFDRLISFGGHGVFFWARLLCGLGLPILVAHLSYESAKIKSNQSATGILYAGCVFVLMGEILGLYLFVLTGIVF